MKIGRVVRVAAAASLVAGSAAIAGARFAERGVAGEAAVRASASAADSPGAADAARPRVIGLTSPDQVASVRAAVHSAREDARSEPMQLPYHEYDGQFIFVRVHTAGEDGLRGGYRRIGNGGPGWSHDWPDAENNLSLILRELTSVRAMLSRDGGNILTLDDPRLFLFPIAYVSEPGRWIMEEREVEPLREYLLKGGFMIFDDFGYGGGGGFGRGRRRCDMCNLAENMKRALPELDFQHLSGSEPVFESFFQIDPNTAQLLGQSGRPDFWGLFEDNDPSKRLIVIAGNGGDLGESWEFEPRGFYAIDLRNEAFKFGVNFIVYAMSH